MKAKVFAVVSALAAVIVAAPQQLQTSLNKATLPLDVAGSAIFQDPCWLICLHHIPRCPRGWVLLSLCYTVFTY